jgi:hypothetical protein
MKKYIEEEIERLHLPLFEGDIDDIIRQLSSLKEQYNTYSKHNLEIYENYSDATLSLYGERLETDEEYSKRIALEKKRDKSKASYKLKKEAQEKLRKEHNDKFKQIREAFNLPPELDLRTLKNALEVIG